jgi:hypothetical protein
MAAESPFVAIAHAVADEILAPPFREKEDVVVKVVEPIPGAWTILSSSNDYKKTDANTAEFTLAVPKDKEVKMTYSVKMRF